MQKATDRTTDGFVIDENQPTRTNQQERSVTYDTGSLPQVLVERHLQLSHDLRDEGLGCSLTQAGAKCSKNVPRCKNCVAFFSTRRSAVAAVTGERRRHATQPSRTGAVAELASLHFLRTSAAFFRLEAPLRRLVA
ncbi:MAG TPA: hypothetical protein VGN07_18665 [Steroidobacteraceae bacterium]|jgi:hypothetical protein